MIEALTIAALVCVGLLILVLLAMAKSQTPAGALARVEAKLDLLLKHADIEYDPYASVPTLVVEALQRGHKIEAIKHYRAATGAGLREAKEFVEEIQRRAGI